MKLERRKVERRVRHGAASLKCASCGHVCEPGSTFCGMCGARIERRLSTRRAAEERATAIANVQLPSPDLAEEQNAADARVSSPSAVKDIPAEAAAPNGSPEPELPPAAPLPEVTPRPPAAIFRSDSPAQRPTPAQRSTIGGPSFLGLNDPPDDAGGDYLLEDEKPSRSYGRAFVFLAILAVVLGFVVVQWRPSLLASLKRFVPSKAAPAPSPQVEQPKPEASPTPEAANTSAVAEPSSTPAPASASDKTVPDQPDSSKPSVAATPAPVEERSKANSEDASARARKDAAK
ncbi:MAG TPA: hypothetical protein VKL40_00965, partial [Candidatus Angelobacter sp.]|nr:hypothetical protein [Candidatus Angelobacter sp.]